MRRKQIVLLGSLQLSQREQLFDKRRHALAEDEQQHQNDADKAVAQNGCVVGEGNQNTGGDKADGNTQKHLGIIATSAVKVLAAGLLFGSPITILGGSMRKVASSLVKNLIADFISCADCGSI